MLEEKKREIKEAGESESCSILPSIQEKTEETNIIQAGHTKRLHLTDTVVIGENKRSYNVP